MSKLVLVSKNSGIVSKEELEPLAIDLQNQLGINVEFYTPKELGTQVTGWHVIEMWLKDTGASIVVSTLITESVKCFCKWAVKRQSKQKKPRPQSFTIYGTDGKIISSNVVDSNGKLNDNEKKSRYPPRPPKSSESFKETSL